MHVGVIGVGRFGKHHVRTLAAIGCDIRWLCATRSASVDEARKLLAPTADVHLTTDYHDVLKDEQCTAVVVATTAATHYAIVKDALNAGKDVLVEKPFVLDVKPAQELAALAQRNNRILMAGHIQLFNPAFIALRDALPSLGKLQLMDGIGCGNGPIRDDMSALWDYCSHDIAMLLELVGRMPDAVIADGKSVDNNGIEDTVSLRLSWKGGPSAHVSGSWLAPIKRREMMVVGEKRYALFDDHAQQKLRFFETRKDATIGSRDTTSTSPQLATDLPLTVELKHFIDCCKTRKKPRSDGRFAVDVTIVLDAAQRSMREGKAVSITPITRR